MKNEKKSNKKDKKIEKASTSNNKNKKERISLDKEKKRKKSSRSISREKKSEKLSNDKKRKKSSRSISREKKSRKSSSSNNSINREKNQTKNQEEDEKEEDITLEKDSENKDLYSLLGLQKNATNIEIRKAYKRLVLLCHPDKNKTDPEASSKFINISRAYKILSNDQSRRYYDETGEYEEGNEGQIDIEDTLNFFRKIYSPRDIESYEDKYINSKEEEQDLITFYNENNGDIRQILECIPCSKNEDIHRFIKIYESLFKKKILKKNKNFEETKNKIKLLKDDSCEKKEAEETLDKLTKQIMLNKKKRNYNDYLNGLAKKYGKNDGNEEQGEENQEISEEEFQKISHRLNKNKKKKNKKK